MVMCFAPDCKHYSEQKICKFFCFPSKQQEKEKWINLIRRERPPSKYSLVCSCHFLNGDRNNGPTIFDHNVKRKFIFSSPEKRKRSTKKKTDEQTAICDITTALEEASIVTDAPSTSFEVLDPVPSSSEASFTDIEAAPSTSGTSRVIRPSSASVEAENYFLKKEVENMTKQLKTLDMSFSFEHIRNNDAHVLMYTGIPSAELFLIIYELLEECTLKYYSGWTVTKIKKIDQFLLTLMKLRMNLPHADLGLRFNCSKPTVTNIVITWLYAMHTVLFNQLVHIPTRRKNRTCLPSAFSDFTNCRIIFDCTEVCSAVPRQMEYQRLTYSSYKHRNTWKALVGVSPNGVISYVSKLYPGSVSDKRIVENSDVLKAMVPGDLIIADKGFLIKDLLPKGVHLNIPPFLTTPQFTEGQVVETKRIARARVHVERAIRRIKCFSILDRIPQYFSMHATALFQTCAALTNWQYPLIKEVEDYYN